MHTPGSPAAHQGNLLPTTAPHLRAEAGRVATLPLAWRGGKGPASWPAACSLDGAPLPACEGDRGRMLLLTELAPPPSRLARATPVTPHLPCPRPSRSSCWSTASPSAAPASPRRRPSSTKCSRADSDAHSTSCCGQMPARRDVAPGSRHTSCPCSSTVPHVGSSWPASKRRAATALRLPERGGAHEAACSKRLALHAHPA